MGKLHFSASQTLAINTANGIAVAVVNHYLGLSEVRTPHFDCPMELRSVTESNRLDGVEVVYGEGSTMTSTARFDGGLRVRMRLIGHMTGYGFHWELKSADVAVRMSCPNKKVEVRVTAQEVRGTLEQVLPSRLQEAVDAAIAALPTW